MIVFPNCKINLGLHVVGKREDGYHDLETVFYPIALNDGLEIITASDFQWNQTGIHIPGNYQDNLIYKAWEMLRNDFPVIPNLQVHLHKVIPMGAGLGGGSSNGAFMLRMLNEKYNLLLSTDQLTRYALALGSDCPFFIVNKPCFATGRGEQLQEISLDLSNFKILVVNLGIHISTKEAFANITPSPSSKSIREIVQQPISSWKTELNNDFEKSVFPSHPEIKVLKEKLYNAGALYASMTGTGSTVFGIFDKNDEPDTSMFQTSFMYWA